MKRLLFFQLVGWCIVVLTAVQTLAQPGTTMYVNGRDLYSAVGEKVVLRGVNEMFIWSNDKQGATILPKIEQSGANAVRLVWLSSGSAADLDSLIKNCIKNKMIPLVDLHDATGNWGNLQTCLNYWKRADVVSVMQKHKKWVLLNIANEAGDASVTNSQFQAAYIDAVAQLRGVGYTMPLIVDASDWGKNENSITATWNAIFQSDPQHNCIFSLHPYWVDPVATQQTRFTNFFNAVVANNIPFIMGEGPEPYGYNCSSPIPYVWVLQQLQNLQIGWLAWSWGHVQNGDCTNLHAYDITNGGNNGNWQNDWGRLIASDDPNSIKNTSVRPPSILGSVPTDTQAPTAPTNLAVSNVTSVGATLTWTASTDNVGVTGYDVYAGATLLSSTTNTTLTLTELTCNSAYTFSVKAKDAAGNVSSASNGASATTSPCDTQAPTPPTNLAASTVSPTNVGLIWTASTDNVGVTGYQVFQGSTLLNGNVTGTTYTVAGLSCNTAYTFTVKAKDAAGNVSVASNTLNMTTPACPTGDVVYADALNSNWDDWSWSAYRNFSNTNPVQEGSNSIRVDYGGFGGFSVHRNAPITPAAGMVIKFWVFSSGNNNLKLYTQSADSGGESPALNFTTNANQWKEITVTMADLGNPSAIRRINIQENAGNSPAVFFDYIRFDTGAPAPDTQAPTAPTNLAASSITASGLTLTWTASTDNVGVTGYQVFQGSTLLNGSVTGTTYAVSGLSCGMGYAFTVKAKDAAGNVSTASNTANATTSACPTNTAVVYNETLGTDWQNWSWSLAVDFNNTNPVKVGSKSAKVDYSGWGGFSLRKGTAVPTSSATVLRFWVRSSATTPIQVYTQTDDSGGENAGYTFKTTSNQWQEISVTMNQLGNPAQIKRINFQNYTGNNVTVYFDNIRLMSVSGARLAAENADEPTILRVFPNPSDGLLTIGYTAQQVEPVKIQVVDASGITLHRQDEQAQAGENTFSLDMRNRTAGWYLIRLQSPNDVNVRKILIQR